MARSRDSLYVETNIVSGITLLKLLMVHFHGFDFSRNIRWGEGNNHPGFDDTCLDATNGDSTDTTDFVDILQRKAEWLIRGSLWGFDGIDGIEEGLAFD